MKKSIIPSLILLSCMACHVPNDNSQNQKGYTPPAIKLSSDVMTPEVLWSFGRIGNVSVSPDGSKAVYLETSTYGSAASTLKPASIKGRKAHCA